MDLKNLYHFRRECDWKHAVIMAVKTDFIESYPPIKQTIYTRKLNRKMHSIAGLPAVETRNGEYISVRFWGKNGVDHRSDDLPYYIDYTTGSKTYKVNGKNHRDYFPAVVYPTIGRNEYWYDGVEMKRWGEKL